jgi:Amt family ammonium transporter
VCRLGGDEFGLLMEHCAIEHALSSADMLRQRTEAYRFSWEGRTFAIGASIGVVMVNADSDDLAGVLQRADAACYAAKEQGRNRVHVYRENDVDLARMRSEMRWVSRINYAIDSNGFELYFQPVHAAVGNDIPYYEFLLRLHEEGVVILPGHFLPAAERYNLSVKIDRWVVAEALRLLCNEVLPGGIEAVWAINLSGASLGDEAFADWVLERIEDSGIAGQRLCFEVTETAAITNFSRALDFFARLQKRGCHLALDDFGSGLSSFAYLKTLPVDYVKIDGMFVRDLETDLIARSIVKAIVDIGHLLGTTTIAEFVESAGAADALLEIGADYLQGFHVARPRPV